MPSDEIDSRRSTHPGLNALARVHDDSVLAGLDARHVDLKVSNRKSVFGTAPGLMHCSGARHHGLGRNAADVDAGAAIVATLDQRCFPSRFAAARDDGRACLARADDNRVKGFRLHTVTPCVDGKKSLCLLTCRGLTGRYASKTRCRIWMLAALSGIQDSPISRSPMA